MSWLTNNAVQIIFRVGVLDINAHGGIFYICEKIIKWLMKNGTFSWLQELRKISVFVTRSLSLAIAFWAVLQNYM